MPRAPKTCNSCSTPLKYDRKTKTHYCPDCLHGAFLTDEAQRAAVKRYRKSDKGKASEKKYELSGKGKAARERYLKSDKYKQRRREYNQRLKESLQIAREGLKGTPRAKALTREELLVPIIDAIQESIANTGHPPTTQSVVQWAENDFQVKITPAEADVLIKRAQR